MGHFFERAYNKVYYITCFIINCIKTRHHRIHVGKNVKMYGVVNISGSGNIYIGDGTIINSCWNSNPASLGKTRTSLAAEGHGEIVVGKNVGISNSTLYSKESIVIEPGVLIGVNCLIYDTDFHSIYAENRVNNNCEVKSKKVVIKSGAWIGGKCIILKGVTIGENAVIGAGSVVTRDVPANEVWAGNPAKFIKKL